MKRTGLCVECGFDWESSPDRLSEQLAAAPQKFEEAFEDREALLRTRPDDCVWSPLEYAAHTRDVLVWYGERIQRVLSEARPHLTAVRWAAATDERRYHRSSTGSVLAGLSDIAMSLSDMLQRLSPEQWERVGIGSEGDDRNVLVLARRAVHEAVHHAMDVQRQTGPRAEGNGNERA